MSDLEKRYNEMYDMATSSDPPNRTQQMESKTQSEPTEVDVTASRRNGQEDESGVLREDAEQSSNTAENQPSTPAEVWSKMNEHKNKHLDIGISGPFSTSTSQLILLSFYRITPTKTNSGGRDSTYNCASRSLS